jgi:hypothetical protein
MQGRIEGGEGGKVNARASIKLILQHTHPPLHKDDQSAQAYDLVGGSITLINCDGCHVLAWKQWIFIGEEVRDEQGKGGRGC